jgi:hypothetical protein
VGLRTLYSKRPFIRGWKDSPLLGFWTVTTAGTSWWSPVTPAIQVLITELPDLSFIASILPHRHGDEFILLGVIWSSITFEEGNDAFCRDESPAFPSYLSSLFMRPAQNKWKEKKIPVGDRPHASTAKACESFFFSFRIRSPDEKRPD